jgi:hypothetical protein
MDGDRAMVRKFENEADARAWFERIRYSTVLRNVRLFAPWSF